MQFLVFKIDAHNLAIELSLIERVILSVEFLPMPNLPEHILGMIDVHGDVIPVFNTRKILNLPEKKIELKDQFIICNFGQGNYAFCVDEVNDIIDCNEKNLITSSQIHGASEPVKYVIKEKDNKTIVVYDWSHLLPMDQYDTVKT